MPETYSASDSFAEYRRKRTREMLTRYAPEPGVPAGQFMGTEIIDLSREELIGLIVWMCEQWTIDRSELSRQRDKLVSLSSGR